MKFCRIACLLFFFILPHGQGAQNDSTLQLDKQQWREMADGIDYSETFKDPEAEKHEKSSVATSTGQGFNLEGLKYVFYILVFAIIVFFTVRVFANSKNNSSVKETAISVDPLHEIEENMHEINLEELLKNALLVKNYGLALRLNFLMIIKLLSQKGQIDWAIEKTNWEYYAELHDKLLADQFKELIISFESFWYGEHPLTEFQYHLTEPSYHAMQKRLKPNE